MLGFLECELGQIHFVSEAPFSPHRGHERLDVLGHRFLAGNELRAQLGGTVAFRLGQRFPVRPVVGEVDIGRIPELRVAPCE